VNTASVEERLSLIHPSQRILLLPHCLRPSQTCLGKYTKQGLECLEDCAEDCTIGRLRRAALRLGYKGVCIAPGGRLAVGYVKENSPKGIVAVACQKELEEGIHGVRELSGSDELTLPIVVIPLTKDGCVDTEVDEEQALKIVALGCSMESGEGGD
jgi:hypothetical protein